VQSNNHTAEAKPITMNNNDILRRTRYILDLKDNQITKIFKHVGVEATEQQVNLWLKREDEAEFVPLTDDDLIDFLDALIIEKRGKKDDAPSVRVKQKLDNNLILMKLKIAFHLKAEEALAVMALAGFKISKHEFSALFRKKDHKHYRACKNQMLRKFMKGLQIKYRGQSNATKSTSSIKSTPSAQSTSPIKKTIIKDIETPKRTGKISLKKKAAKPPAKPKEQVINEEKLAPSASDSKPTDASKSIERKADKADKAVKTDKTDNADKAEKPKTAASVWKIPKK
jgi:uncharacterized protein YehS (DUF1456 family)